MVGPRNGFPHQFNSNVHRHFDVGHGIDDGIGLLPQMRRLRLGAAATGGDGRQSPIAPYRAA
jgi:hypothetical protein